MAEQSLTVKVEAKGVGDLGAPFKKLKDGAKEAHLSLQSMSAGAGRVKESIEGIKSGLLGLSVSSNLLPASIGKAANALNALGSAAALLKGAGGLGSGLVGAVGGGPLALLAGGITALGSAAVLASPKLQDTLGDALLQVTGQAEEMEAALKRAKDRLDDIRKARSLGIGTAEEENKARLRLSVEGPGRDRQRSLEEQRTRMESRAAGLAQFPDTEFDIFGDDRLKDLKPMDAAGGSLAALRENLETLQGAAATPLLPASLLRQEMEEEAVRKLLAGQASDANARRDDVLQRFEVTKRHGEAGLKLDAVNAQIEAEKNKGSEAQGLGFFLRTQLRGYTDEDLKSARDLNESGRSNFLDQQLFGYFEDGGGREGKKLQALRAQAAGLEQERASALSALNGRKFTTGAEVEDVLKQQEAAADRLRAQEEKLLAVKQQINRAEIDSLKNIQQSVEAQKKLAAEAVKQQEASIRGAKIGFAVDQDDKLQALSVSRKIKAGRELSEEDIKFARGNDLLREFGDKAALARADRDPVIQEILKNIGAQEKLSGLKQAEAALVKLDTNIKHDIQVKVEASAQELAGELNNKVVPAITKAIEDLGRTISTMLEVRMSGEIQKAFWEQSAARRAAGGG
ncbi:MAG: hypothetical protein JNM56_22450 [Planctomycetia bacterium]|nr:hypothetical protein [Planctomycetia bacterium]